MSILIIGNGFDIAHNLPTQYSDFLDFAKAVINPDGSDYDRFIQNLTTSNEKLIDEIRELIKPNLLLDYFLSIYEDRCKDGKDGWIDFESEIAYIVKNLDKAKRYILEQSDDPNYRTNLPMSLIKSLSPIIVANGGETWNDYGYTFDTAFIDGQSKRVYEELKKVTRLLEIYLKEYVEKNKCVYRIPDLKGLEIDHVLSFNYTDTYSKYYDHDNKTDYCYIHGEAKDSSVDHCNLVLGIDEYLTSDRADNDNNYVWFKKFYQRIYKETDSSYIDWLNESDLINEMLPNADIHIDIYIYGHSLDVTDKDVLYKMIMMKNATTHIFYHNKNSMAKQISNLVKVIGEENLIRMTGGKNKAIRFIQSKPAVKIE